jgi:hypothetical protein
MARFHAGRGLIHILITRANREGRLGQRTFSRRRRSVSSRRVENCFRLKGLVFGGRCRGCELCRCGASRRGFRRRARE